MCEDVKMCRAGADVQSWCIGEEVQRWLKVVEVIVKLQH